MGVDLLYITSIIPNDVFMNYMKVRGLPDELICVFWLNTTCTKS